MKHLFEFELDLEEIQCCNCLQTLGTYDPNTYTYDTKSWFATNNKLDYYCDMECYNNSEGILTKINDERKYVKDPLVFAYDIQKGFYNIK